MSLKRLNAWIKKTWPDIDVELVKGSGYFYYDGEDGLDKMSSICINSFSQMSFDKWKEIVKSDINNTYKGKCDV